MILLRIFKNSRMAGIAGMVLLLLGLFLTSFIRDFSSAGNPAVHAHQGMPFYNLIFGAIHTLPALNHIIAMLFMVLISYMLIRINVRDALLEQRTFMPAFFFLLFTCALPEARQVNPALIGSVFYLFCFAILFEVHDKKPDSYAIFAAALFLVAGSLFCLRLIWFVPLIWLSLRTVRQVTLRELFYPVLAYLILGLFMFTWYWGVLDDGARFGKVLRENLAFTGSFVPQHYSVYLLYGYILFLVAVASLHMIDHFQTRKSYIQNIFQVLFYMFVAGILFYVFVTRFDPSSLVFVAFPVSYLLTNYFHRRRNPWIHELAMWILLGLVVYVQVMV